MSRYFKLILFLAVLIFTAIVSQQKASAAMCGLLVPTDNGTSCLYGQHYGDPAKYQSLNAGGYMDWCNNIKYNPTRQKRIDCLKRRFNEKIKTYRFDGQTHQKVGAQYIMTSIIGRDTSNTTKDYNDMVAAINNSKTEITIDYSYPFYKNTGFLPVNSNFNSTGSVKIYNDKQTVPALVIKNSGKLITAIKLNCGNTVYGSEKPTTIDWTLIGTSSFDGSATVSPGDDVTFRHKVLNNGPDAALYRYRILYAHLRNGEQNDIIKYSNPFSGLTWVADGVPKGELRPTGIGTEGVNGTHVLRNIGNVSDGDKLCELIQFTDATGPDSDPDNYNGKSNSACVTVKAPAKFNLTPTGSIKLNDDENPSQAIYNYCVNLTNANVSSIGANITVRLYKNGGIISASPNNTAITINSPQYCVNNQALNVSGLTAGDQVCITTFVTPTSDSNTGTANSGSACDTVVNKPIFRAFNGNISAGQCSANSGGYLASWFNNNSSLAYNQFTGAATNLGTLASNTTIGLASARGNIQPYGSNVLTFAKNTTTSKDRDKDSPEFGIAFSAVPCLKDASQGSGAISLTGSSLNWSSISNTEDKQYTFNGNLNIPQNNAYNKKASIFVDGDVYISGNIKYANTDSWAQASDIPKLVIRAKGNIYISGSVTELNGLYIAKPKDASSGGAIYTCANVTASTTSGGPGYITSQLWSNCGGSAPLTPANSLTVYGVFIANKVNLLRTAGSLRSASGINDAAERFYMSPEIYLNGTNLYTSGSSSGVLPYDAIYNLPPVL